MIYLSEETEALARRIAEARRVSMEDAIKLALEQSARDAGIELHAPRPRDPSPKAVAARKARLDEIAGEIARMPVLDRRSPGEIMDDLNRL